MTTMLGVHDVARYFLAKQSDGDISNKKLQKLCYYAQGVSFAVRGKPMWSGTRIKAWEQGPVIPDVWQTYRDYSWHPIPRPADFDESRYDASTREVLDMVYASFGRLDADHLSAMTHTETPWLEAFERSKVKAHDDAITDASLRAYFAHPTGASAEVLAQAIWAHLRGADPEWDAASAGAHEEITSGKGISIKELRSLRGL